MGLLEIENKIVEEAQAEARQIALQAAAEADQIIQAMDRTACAPMSTLLSAESGMQMTRVFMRSAAAQICATT